MSEQVHVTSEEVQHKGKVSVKKSWKVCILSGALKKARGSRTGAVGGPQWGLGTDARRRVWDAFLPWKPSKANLGHLQLYFKQLFQVGHSGWCCLI